MTSRFWRVVNFANLPIRLLAPKTYTNITEIELKTIPSASKIDIKRVLESVYGFEVEKVNTLNRAGKVRKGRGFILKKPDYKKAYVTLRKPLSISPDLFPLREVAEERRRIHKVSEAKTSIVGGEVQAKKHWLQEKVAERAKPEERYRSRREGFVKDRRPPAPVREGPPAKFPWSSMRSARDW